MSVSVLCIVELYPFLLSLSDNIYTTSLLIRNSGSRRVTIDYLQSPSLHSTSLSWLPNERSRCRVSLQPVVERISERSLGKF